MRGTEKVEEGDFTKTQKTDIPKMLIVGALLLICLGLTYYFQIVLRIEVLYTHFFYVPIILACIWWGWKGAPVAILLGIAVLALHVVGRPGQSLGPNILRASMFMAVGAVTSLLSERRASLEEEMRYYTRRLESANARLKELDQLKSMFIASMSHELRTPLNSIIGFTGIILQGMTGDITEEQRKQLTMVKNSANHLLALINDVIDVSKIEAGEVELDIGDFDLSAVVMEVKDSFSIAAGEGGLELSLDAPGKLVIENDERRTKQVLVNLVGNALKFTERGGVEIEVGKRKEMAEASVRDTGIGIKEEDMEKLFKPFSQLPIEGRVKEGTGLGLYLSKKISELLGGSIEVKSEFGKGSEFTFVLPLRHAGAGK